MREFMGTHADGSPCVFKSEDSGADEQHAKLVFLSLVHEYFGDESPEQWHGKAFQDMFETMWVMTRSAMKSRSLHLLPGVLRRLENTEAEGVIAQCDVIVMECPHGSSLLELTMAAGHPGEGEITEEQERLLFEAIAEEAADQGYVPKNIRFGTDSVKKYDNNSEGLGQAFHASLQKRIDAEAEEFRLALDEGLKSWGRGGESNE